MTGAAIGADVDPGQHQLTMATLHQSIRLAHNVIQCAAARSTTREWDDTEGTGEITAILNFYISPSVIRVVPYAFDGKIPTADFLAVHHLGLARLLGQVDEVDEPHLVLRADNQIHPSHVP